MKLFFAFFAFASASLYAQSALSFDVQNFSSTSIMRSVLPLGGTPPIVLVFISDATGGDAYSVALAYHDAAGIARTATMSQLVTLAGSPNTVATFFLNVFQLDSVTVMPLKLTGLMVKQ